jgi:GNAT superfamily N-acetyltransferase
MEFEIVRDPDEALESDLWRRLHEVGVQRLGVPALSETAFYAGLCRENGAIVGAFLAYVFFRGLNLQLLWVDEAYRGKGVGKMLLERAETLAKQHQCTVVFGFSFGFQAPEFYTKLGYEEIGRIADYPEGYDCVFLSKRLG